MSTKTKQTTVQAIGVSPHAFDLAHGDGDAGHYELSTTIVNGKREKEILDQTHEKYFAQEATNALARHAAANQIGRTRFNSALLSSAMEEISAREEAGQYGKYAGMMEAFHVQALTRSGCYLLELDQIAHERDAADLKHPIEPLSARVAEEPPKPKKRGFFERVFGD